MDNKEDRDVWIAGDTKMRDMSTILSGRVAYRKEENMSWSAVWESKVDA